MSDRKKTICFDFDGVIHSYQAPWVSATHIPDPPVEGVREFLDRLSNDYRIVVLSTRTATPEGADAVRAWLKYWRIPFDDVVSTKPPAEAYVDDRAVPFEGDWDEVSRGIDTLVHRPSLHTEWRKRQQR